MQGNSHQSRSTSWKHSIVKHSTTYSRILTDNKDIITKFSPVKNADTARNNTSKSLVKSKIMCRSYDQIILSDMKESSVKDKSIQKKQTISTPRQMVNNFKSPQSEEKFNLKVQSPINRKQSRRGPTTSHNIDFIKDIKMQYLSFKQRVLNQLKRQQELIKKAIEQIMFIVSRSVNNKTRTSVVQQKNYPKTSQISIFDSPIDFTKNVSKINYPKNMAVDTAKIRESLVTEKIEIESVMPKIKQRVNKMFDLMGQLKNQINDQSFHSLREQQRLEQYR